MTIEDFDKIDLHGQDIKCLDAKMKGLKKCLWWVSGFFVVLLVAAVVIGLACNIYDDKIRLLYCFIVSVLIAWGVLALIIWWEMKQIFPIIRSLSDNREKLRREVFLSSFRSEMFNKKQENGKKQAGEDKGQKN